MKRNFMIAITLLLSVSAAFAQTQIKSQADLANIEKDLTGSYILMNDITLTGNWTPITEFQGTFDGNGKVLSNLTINKESDNVGLFAKTKKATIKKLGIEKATVKGGTATTGNKIGILVGEAKETSIEQCYVANSSVEGYTNVGSLVGKFEASGTTRNSLKDSYSDAKVTALSDNAGGLIGAASMADITRCYYSGIAECKGSKGTAGGIMATNSGNIVEISHCVAASPYIMAPTTGRIYGKLTSGKLNIYANYGTQEMKLGSTQANLAEVPVAAVSVKDKHGTSISLEAEEFTSTHPDYKKADIDDAWGQFIYQYQASCTTKKIYSASARVNATGKGNLAAIWVQAIYWDMAMNRHKKTQKKGDKTFVDLLYDGNYNHYAKFNWHDENQETGWFIYDDIMWWTASLARAYKYYGDEKYLGYAESSYERVLFGSPIIKDPGSWDNDPKRGGMFWRWEPKDPTAPWWRRDNGKAACINFPTIIAATTLYETTEKKEYLDQAKAIYAWAQDSLIRADGYIYDMCHGGRSNGTDNLYNSGTAIGASVAMYKTTGEKHYLNNAILIADYVKNKKCASTDSYLPTAYGEEQGIYAAIFAQYMADLIFECGQYQYLSWMRYNINAGWNNRHKSTSITCPDFRVKLSGMSWSYQDDKGDTKTKVIKSYDASAIPALMLLIPSREELSLKGNLQETEFYRDGMGWDTDNVWAVSGGLPTLSFGPTGKDTIETSRENFFSAFSDNGCLTVKTEQPCEVAIYDLRGVLLSQKTIEEQSAFHHVPSGIYVVKATANGQSETQKVVNN